jgi:hypothetical protein
MNQMTREQLEREFSDRGIGPFEPGFYDYPEFLEAEREDRKFLAKYAAYVDYLPLTPEYAARVRSTVTRLSTYLFEQLNRDGREGACVDISGAFARMLDEEKIWAYPVGGGVGIRFPGNEKSYFGAISLPGTPVAAGHMWVCAPPYTVVDISLSLQPWSQERREFLPGNPILSEVASPFEATIFELMDMDYIRWVRRTYGQEPTVGQLLQNYPWLGPVLQQFPATTFPYGQLSLSYVPVGIKMSPKALDGMQAPTLNGLSPAELYADFKRQP